MGKISDILSKAITILHGTRIPNKQEVHLIDSLPKQKLFYYGYNSLYEALTKVLSRDCDPLIDEVVAQIISSKIPVSHSAIQRHFEISFTRAGRIIKQLEDANIVSPDSDGNNRKLLICSFQELEDMLNKKLKALQFSEKQAYNEFSTEVYDTLKEFVQDKSKKNDMNVINDGDIFFEDSVLADLKRDDDGFITYPNGIKFFISDEAFYTDSFLNKITKSLGYNLGEMTFFFHSDDGSLVTAELATTMSLFEIISNHFVCIIRNDSKILNSNELKIFYSATIERQKNQDFWNSFYLMRGARDHSISRDFIERVFHKLIYIPVPFNLSQITKYLSSQNINIRSITESIDKEVTNYDISDFDSQTSLYKRMLLQKSTMEIEFSIPHIDVKQLNNGSVRLAFPNFSKKIDDYTFTFGGSNYEWLAECKKNGFSMLALSSILVFDNAYYTFSLSCDGNEKNFVNQQAEYYSRIDERIRQNPQFCNKFIIHKETSNEWEEISHELVNYIAIAAYYKQCDVSQDVFLKSTDSDYEIISRNSKNGIESIAIQAYGETFVFIGGHSMPEHILSNQEFGNNNQHSCVTDSEQGYIYVMINPSIEGLVKIGKTIRDPKDRARELSTATGVPTPFILVYYKKFNNCHLAEIEIHSLLESHGYRINSKREFFSIPTSDAIDIINKYAEENP